MENAKRSKNSFLKTQITFVILSNFKKFITRTPLKRQHSLHRYQTFLNALYSVERSREDRDQPMLSDLFDSRMNYWRRPLIKSGRRPSDTPPKGALYTYSARGVLGFVDLSARESRNEEAPGKNTGHVICDSRGDN